MQCMELNWIQATQNSGSAIGLLGVTWYNNRLMKRPTHLFAVVLFALTQFVAPFAHAHVNGIQAGTSIHIDGILHHVSSSGQSQCHADSHESPAISVQQEYQRDDAAIVPAIRVSDLHPLAANGTPLVVNEYVSLHPVSFAYHRPHPQAPPA